MKAEFMEPVKPDVELILSYDEAKALYYKLGSIARLNFIPTNDEDRRVLGLYNVLFDLLQSRS